MKTGLGFVQGHWKWHHFDRFVFHSNYGAILYRLRDIATYWYKIAKFLYSTCIYHARTGWTRRNFVIMFAANKIRMIGLPYGVKNYDNMLYGFHLIPERHGQTDGRTNIIAISILRDWRAIKKLTKSNNKLSCRSEKRDVSCYWIIEYFAKSLEVTQGHRKQHHSIDRIRIRAP